MHLTEKTCQMHTLYQKIYFKSEGKIKTFRQNLRKLIRAKFALQKIYLYKGSSLGRRTMIQD